MSERGLQERVARLEGRGESFAHRFRGVDRRFDAVVRRMDARFESVEKRLEAIKRRVDGRFESTTGFGERADDFEDPFLERLDRRFDALDELLSKQFRWIFGLQMITLASIIGLLFAALLMR